MIVENKKDTKKVQKTLKEFIREGNARGNEIKDIGSETLDNEQGCDNHKLERFILYLPHKTGTKEGISPDVLKARVHVINKNWET